MLLFGKSSFSKRSIFCCLCCCSKLISFACHFSHCIALVGAVQLGGRRQYNRGTRQRRSGGGPRILARIVGRDRIRSHKPRQLSVKFYTGMLGCLDGVNCAIRMQIQYGAVDRSG